MRSRCWMLVFISFLGCGSDPESPCPQLKPCDVTQLSCQAHALTVAQCWRGESGPVAVSVVLQSRSEFSRINAEDAAKAQLDPEAAVIRRGYALYDLSPWHFVERQAADARSAWAAAYYSAANKKIVIISERQPDPTDVEILVHEYVHALQDASGDLGRRPSNSFDEFLASRAMIEGEARLIQRLALATGHGFSPESVDFEKIAESSVLNSDGRALRDADLLTNAYRIFTYSYGFRQVLSTWRRGGAQGVKSAWMNPLVTTRPYVAGPMAPVPHTGWSQDISAVAEPKVSGDFRLVDSTSLGQWLTQAALSKALRNCVTVSQLPEVAADSFSIWHSPTTGVVLAAWRIRFAFGPLGTDDATTTTRELVTALRSCTTHNVRRDDPGLVLLATSSVPSAPEGLVTGWGPSESPPAALKKRFVWEKLGIVDERTVHGLYGHALRE